MKPYSQRNLNIVSARQADWLIVLLGYLQTNGKSVINQLVDNACKVAACVILWEKKMEFILKTDWPTP